MLHPLVTPVGSATQTWLASIGPYGSWGDLSWTTRWGDGACGMFEASFTTPLPKAFEHPALRMNSLVDLMNGPYRVGSSLYISDIVRGTGLDDPWTITCTGIGREVEGDNSWLAIDSVPAASSVASAVIDRAIGQGLRWAGRDGTVPTTAFGSSATTDSLNSIGSLLNSVGKGANAKWGVGQDNIIRFMSDPTTPTWTIAPDQIPLGQADDNYATVVWVNYKSAVTGGYARVFSPATPSGVQTLFSRREFPADFSGLGAISAADAQALADGLLAQLKGRIGLTSGLTLTSNQILNAGGVPADLSMVEAGQMARIHGVTSDLLAINGQTYYDFVIGQTRYTDGAPTIQVDPMGLAARDFAAVVEAMGGVAA